MDSDRLFGFIILLYRLAGIPFHIKKISIIYAIYMRTVIICASMSYLGMYKYNLLNKCFTLCSLYNIMIYNLF